MATKVKQEQGAQLAFETSIRVDIKEILPNPYQPMGRIVPPKEALERIVASIREHGLIQTPVVRRRADGKYEMGDGWIRRCAYEQIMNESRTAEAASKYGSLPVNIRELTDRQMADLIVEANMVRLDLSPIDLAKFYVKYLEDFKITQTELARLHGCSQGEIANTIRLLDLPADIQAKVISREISETHARSLLQLGDQLDDKKKVYKIIANIVENHASVGEIDREIKRELWESTMSLGGGQYDSNKLLFDISACEKCDFRQLLKYPWGGTKDEKQPRCTNKTCWKEKQDAAVQDRNKEFLVKLAEQGITKLVAAVDYKTTERFYGAQLKECKVCPKRVACKDNYSNQTAIYCTDKKCYGGKEKVREAEWKRKDTADRHAQEVEGQKKAEHTKEIMAGIDAESNFTLLAIIDCLITANDDTDAVLNFIKAFNLIELKLDEDGDIEDLDNITGEKIVAAAAAAAGLLPQDNGAELLTRMIARLAFECVNSYGSKKDKDRLLNAFKSCSCSSNQPMPTEKKAKKAAGVEILQMER